MNRATVREVADLYFDRFQALLDKGLAEVRAEMDRGFAEVRAELRGEFNKGLAEVRTELANQRADLIRWMFIFWVGTVVPLAGMMIALVRL